MTEEAEVAATTPAKTLDIRAILAALPHRYPMLLVDRVVSLVPDEEIHAVKAVSFNEGFFQGHFPSYPVMPAVLLIEAMAQTGAVLMSKSLDVDVAGKAIFFMSADNCRFRSPVRPGDVVRMPVRVVRHRGDVFKFAGQAMVGDKVAAECEFAAMVVET